ncbi:MAG: VOC family protein [Chloroflexi bacterium]|nr:VOC family protein [Chloroflexota bacterium]
MSPVKRATKRTVRHTAKRATAKRAPRGARKPTAPPRLTEDFRDLNVVSVNVTDWARARKFYHETLGLPIAAEIDGVGWLELGLPNQTHFALNRWDGPEPAPTNSGNATVVFGVDDARAVMDKLRAKGVRCEEVVEIPGMVIYGTFYDPDGNRLQVAQSPR